MTSLDIGNAQSGDTTGVVGTTSVSTKSLDIPSGVSETSWQNADWGKQYGYFLQIPDLQSALILKTAWIVGRGYTADPETSAILDHISGSGKQSFRDILFNMKLMALIGGDSYSEIVWDDKEKKNYPLNIKPLDPANVKEVYDKTGMRIRYEYNNGAGQEPTKFDPDEILHLSNCRIGNQIHGISVITALEPTIKADNENFLDIQKIMHRGAVPMILWKIKTDDTAKISALMTKINTARKLSEPDFAIPDDENIVSHEVIQIDVVPSFMSWRDDLRNKFYRTIALPQIVPGGSGQSTQSEANVIYLAHEQIVENDQLYIEEQIWNQLYLRIKLTRPASMSPMLQQNQAKAGAPIQQGDVNPAAGRQ